MADLQWLLEIESIAMNGIINDGKGARYAVTVEAPTIRPGQSSTLSAQLQLVAAQALPSGLRALDVQAQLSFTQKASGGFEALRLESTTSGSDAQGGQLIAVNQAFDLALQQAEGRATLSAVLDADLPQPQLLMPQLAPLGAVQIQAQVRASTDGAAVTLAAADLNVSAAGAPLLTVDLEQAMQVGGEQKLSGELLHVTLNELPLEWLNPWLAPGLRVEGPPVSLQCAVAAAPQGDFSLRFAEPIKLGPLTVRDADVLLLENISLMLDPELAWRADQSLTYTLKSLSLSDRYGPFVSGTSAGQFSPNQPPEAGHYFAGITSRSQVQIGLQELFQLPVLDGQASIVGGQLSVDVHVDGQAGIRFHRINECHLQP